MPKARFPLGDFFRSKRRFPLLASLITSANAMPTKEKVASREKSRLVENGLNECKHEARPRNSGKRQHLKMNTVL